MVEVYTQEDTEVDWQKLQKQIKLTRPERRAKRDILMTGGLSVRRSRYKDHRMKAAMKTKDNASSAGTSTKYQPKPFTREYGGLTWAIPTLLRPTRFGHTEDKQEYRGSDERPAQPIDPAIGSRVMSIRRDDKVRADHQGEDETGEEEEKV